MRLIIDRNMYKMTVQQKNATLAIASRMIKKGIYAVEKERICELKKEKYSTSAELQNAVKDYEEKGFKVHYNG